MQSWVSGLIDDAHAAAAELGNDLVGTEPGSGDHAHGRGRL